jgi:nucleotide-binding universal stress UspA family protein
MIRFPPKKILVPFDLSRASLLAWRQARQLATRFGASLEVLYVQELLPTGKEWPYGFQSITAKRKQEITERIRSKIGAGIPIRVLEGDPVVTVLRLARTRHPDLIVMGTHGRVGFEHFWAGSVAESVVRLSSVPVLIVRRPSKAIRSVLAPVNFESYSDHGFIYAASVASALEARLTALNVAPDAAACRKGHWRLSDLISRLPSHVQQACRPKAEVQKGQPIEAILKMARRNDLIVLVAHRKSLLKDIVLGMTAEHVIRSSSVPVLTVPAPKKTLSPEGIWGLGSMEKAAAGKIF